jgi:hypothetical protein
MLCVRKRWYFGAGVALALTTVEPHVLYLWILLVVWWIVVNRHWRVVLGAAVTVLGSIAILTVLRPEWVRDYLTALETPPLYWATPTLGAVARSAFQIQASYVQYIPSVIGLAGLILFQLKRGRLVSLAEDMNWVLLLSVVTTFFGWSYDQMVLLPVFLLLFAGLWDHQCDCRSKMLVGGGLLLYSAGLVVLNLLEVSELYKFWLPWVLLVTYLLSRVNSPRAARSSQ